MFEEDAKRMRRVDFRSTQILREASIVQARISLLGGADARCRGRHQQSDPIRTVSANCRTRLIKETICLDTKPRQSVVAALVGSIRIRQGGLLKAAYATDCTGQWLAREIILAQASALLAQGIEVVGQASAKSRCRGVRGDEDRIDGVGHAVSTSWGFRGV